MTPREIRERAQSIAVDQRRDLRDVRNDVEVDLAIQSAITLAEAGFFAASCAAGLDRERAVIVAWHTCRALWHVSDVVWRPWDALFQEMQVFTPDFAADLPAAMAELTWTFMPQRGRGEWQAVSGSRRFFVRRDDGGFRFGLASDPFIDGAGPTLPEAVAAMVNQLQVHEGREMAAQRHVVDRLNAYGAILLELGRRS